ncbi:MAG: phenylacetate--CoA ligase family protein [Haloglomus sp.]
MGTARMLGFLVRLTSNAYRSRSAIERERDSRLETLLRHAYDESPFHRERFRAAGFDRSDLDADALAELPTMSAADLDDAFDRIVTDPAVRLADLRSFVRDSDDRHERFRGEYVALHSSGTTGDPTPFLFDEREWDRVLAAYMRSPVLAVGLRSFLSDLRGEVRAAYVGGVEGRFQGITVSEAVSDRLGEALEAIPPDTPPERMSERLRSFEPTRLVGYPTTLLSVAELAGTGDWMPTLDRVVSSGEPLPPDTRRTLREALGAPVDNTYAATEVGPLGLDPDGGSGMFLFDDWTVVELLDGRVVVTPLYNRTLPLVRYELGDRLVERDDGGGDRLPFRTAASVVGRTEERLRFEGPSVPAGGGVLFATALNEVEAPGLANIQFVDAGASSFTVRVAPQPGAEAAAVRDRVRNEVESLLCARDLEGVDFEVREAPIEPDPLTGKAPLVVDTASASGSSPGDGGMG